MNAAVADRRTAPNIERPTKSSTGWARFPAELALIGVTLATIYQLDPLFINNSYFMPLAIVAIVIHSVLALARRAPGGALLGLVLAAVALPVVIGIMFYPETTIFGIPTLETLRTASADLTFGWQNFQTETPPTEVNSAYLVAASGVVWMVAVLSDWAAFRFWSPGEALLPSLSAVIFAAFLDRIFINVRGAFVYLIAALLFLLLHRVAERIMSGTWLGRESGRSYAQLVVGGLAILAVALGLVVFLAPSVPGYDEGPIYPVFDPEDGTGGSGNDERTVANPLVDIKDRLQADPEVEVFTVRSDRPSYWRTTALGLFDGGQFRARATYETVEDNLPEGFPLGIPTSDITSSTQEYAITALSQEWLPAAYLPVEIETAGNVPVQFEKDSGTLITGGNNQLSNGINYTVRSEIPLFTPENLQTGATAQVDNVYLELPTNFDPSITTLAQEVTAGKNTVYEKSLALQDYFQRTGNFTYSLEPAPGHSVSSIQEFLQRRSGYCEQFSVTYAAMARSIGIPSRVAVGFTQGEADPVDPNLYHVKNKHAHAWPEVFVAGAGWVPFEPTPGRGMPGAERYTMLAANQQDSEPSPIPTTQPEVQAPEPAAPTPPQGAPTPTPRAADANPEPPPEGQASDTHRTISIADSVYAFVTGHMGFFVLIGTGIAAALLALVGIRQLKLQRYVLRRSGAGWSLVQINEPAERIEHSWRVATDALAFNGPAPVTTETNSEFLDRTKDISPVVANNLSTFRQLGRAVTASRFSSRPIDDADVEQAEADATTIVDASFADTSLFDQWFWKLDPRPLVDTWRRRGLNKVPTVATAPGAPVVGSVHTAIIPPPPSGAVPEATDEPVEDAPKHTSPAG